MNWELQYITGPLQQLIGNYITSRARSNNDLGITLHHEPAPTINWELHHTTGPLQQWIGNYITSRARSNN